MNYYIEIKDKLLKNDINKKVIEHYNNRNDLTTYYEVGKLLSEAGKHYGEGIIKEYANKLKIDVGKKYDISTLFKIKKFYYLFGVLKVAPLAPQLSWSHYVEILPLEDVNAINYYINISINGYLSRNKLREKIRNKEYQRLDDTVKEKLSMNQELEVIDFIKDPIILNRKKDYDKISELVLKEIIMNDLDNFLKELGNGFCYIESEYKIRIGESFNYIDILLFNIIFNCYVVVELKINKLTKQDIGQIQVYMNYVNENLKTIHHTKTIGIIVCKENNKYLIKYSSDSRIHAVTYEIV